MVCDELSFASFKQHQRPVPLSKRLSGRARRTHSALRPGPPPPKAGCAVRAAAALWRACVGRVAGGGGIGGGGTSCRAAGRVAFAVGGALLEVLGAVYAAQPAVGVTPPEGHGGAVDADAMQAGPAAEAEEAAALGLVPFPLEALCPRAALDARASHHVRGPLRRKQGEQIWGLAEGDKLGDKQGRQAGV